jgi:hypothetical protein
LAKGNSMVATLPFIGSISFLESSSCEATVYFSSSDWIGPSSKVGPTIHFPHSHSLMMTSKRSVSKELVLACVIAITESLGISLVLLVTFSGFSSQTLGVSSGLWSTIHVSPSRFQEKHQNYSACHSLLAEQSGDSIRLFYLRQFQLMALRWPTSHPWWILRIVDSEVSPLAKRCVSGIPFNGGWVNCQRWPNCSTMLFRWIGCFRSICMGYSESFFLLK